MVNQYEPRPKKNKNKNKNKNQKQKYKKQTNKMHLIHNTIDVILIEIWKQYLPLIN